VADPPVILMAHGFGAERTHRLPAFAERFAVDHFRPYTGDTFERTVDRELASLDCHLRS